MQGGECQQLTQQKLARRTINYDGLTLMHSLLLRLERVGDQWADTPRCCRYVNRLVRFYVQEGSLKQSVKVSFGLFASRIRCRSLQFKYT
eukprot:COSAG02_NODE_836_length_16647_cov_17.589014_6_plen_90_part_00